MLSALFLTVTLQTPRVPTLLALERELTQVCERFHGRIGYSLKVLKTGERIGYRENERFPTASTIKTAVMVEAIRRVEEGKIKWTDQRPVPPMSGRQSSMWSYWFRDGIKVDLDGWVNLMITVSDNTATMVLREWLGIDAINARMESLGLKSTKVFGPFPASETEKFRLRGVFGLGVTTPREMNRLLELIYLRKAASPAGCEKMLRILGRQYWDDWIASTVPPEIKIASKTGAINRSRSDTAIVFSDNPYVLTIYTDSQVDQRWVADNEGDQAIIKIAGAVWKRLHPNRPYQQPKGWERFAPTGGGVEGG